MHARTSAQAHAQPPVCPTWASRMGEQSRGRQRPCRSSTDHLRRPSSKKQTPRKRARSSRGSRKAAAALHARWLGWVGGWGFQVSGRIGAPRSAAAGWLQGIGLGPAAEAHWWQVPSMFAQAGPPECAGGQGRVSTQPVAGARQLGAAVKHGVDASLHRQSQQGLPHRLALHGKPAGKKVQHVWYQSWQGLRGELVHARFWQAVPPPGLMQ